jgi:hypothetical protein
MGRKTDLVEAGTKRKRMPSTKVIEAIKEVEPPKKKKKDEDVEKKSVMLSSLLKTVNPPVIIESSLAIPKKNQKMSKLKRKSKIDESKSPWRFLFSFVEKQNMWRCNYLPDIGSIRGKVHSTLLKAKRTDKLKEHLKVWHPLLFKEAENTIAKGESMVKFAVERAKVEVGRKEKRKQSLLQFSSTSKFRFLFFYFVNDFFIDIVLKGDSALLKVILFLFSIIENNLSFSLTSSMSYQAFMQECNVAKLPSRQSLITKYIPALFHLVFDQLLAPVKKSMSVSLTSDVWTNCSLQSFLSITYHYINEEWQLQGSCLDVIPLRDYRHIARNLAVLIRARIAQTLGEKTIITSIVTDGAAVMKVKYKY